MERDYKKRVEALSDEELLNMIDRDTDNYTEEALKEARLEATKRGGIEKLYEKAEAEFQRKENEEERLQQEEEQLTQFEESDTEGGASTVGMFSRTRILKEELILNKWSTLIDHGAGHADEVLDEIMRRLEEAQIPGDCTWSVEEIKSSTWIARVRREFLIVNLDQFKDYHIYIGIRDYGIHLDCCRFLTVEPGLLKKWISEKITGHIDAFSAPKNILVEQDLSAWATVVHEAVLASVKSLMNKLGQDPALLQRQSKGILEIW